jgi:hypothetical protein
MSALLSQVVPNAQRIYFRKVGSGKSRLVKASELKSLLKSDPVMEVYQAGLWAAKSGQGIGTLLVAAPTH